MWIPIKDIKDDDKFYRGTAFKLLPTEAGKKIGHSYSEEGLEYIMFPFVGESEYMSLICLSVGEAGNTICNMKMADKWFVEGREIKRMLLSDLDEVFINPDARYQVVGQEEIQHLQKGGNTYTESY
ncbi:MAG: hypothetical protein LBU57_01200 [Dysgonamonadaceae bacterium]|jgi:hypothetical protein|nr:hypothetical protein [Dysgonamonadaceae bacterium]